MPLLRSLFNLSLPTALVLCLSEAVAEEAVLFGSSAGGNLKFVVEFTQPLKVPVSVFPGISGYATGEMGFHSTILDDPTNDFFQLSTAADFRFVLLAKDPGMEVWNDHGSGYMATNETFFIGSPPFDTHPIWNIVSGTPGNNYSLTLKLRDLNGLYPDSDPFVLSFTPDQNLYALSINKVDSLHVAVSWPTNAVGWELESSDSFVSWGTVTNTAGIARTNFSLNISPTETQQFFRLHQP